MNMKNLVIAHGLFILVGIAYLLGSILQIVSLGFIRISLPANEKIYSRFPYRNV